LFRGYSGSCHLLLLLARFWVVIVMLSQSVQLMVPIM
jgi:hypothetical protein